MDDYPPPRLGGTFTVRSRAATTHLPEMFASQPAPLFLLSLIETLTMIQRLQVGTRLSGAVISGGIAYLSGQVPADATADIRDQTRSVLARIDALLQAAGTDKTKVLSAVIYLTDIGNFAAMNEIWEKWIAAGLPPSRTTVEAKLANPAYLIEITVVATGATPDEG